MADIHAQVRPTEAVVPFLVNREAAFEGVWPSASSTSVRLEGPGISLASVSGLAATRPDPATRQPPS